MKLHLIRHCESEGNVLRRFISLAHHHPLTRTGEKQAVALREHLESQVSTTGEIWHSPALRTRQTAEILQAGLAGRSLRELEALREVDVGVLEGRSEEDPGAMTVFHETVIRWGKGDVEAGFDQGDSMSDVIGTQNRSESCSISLRIRGTNRFSSLLWISRTISSWIVMMILDLQW